MEKTGHYARWKEDFALLPELGIEFLRYGVPYYKTHTGRASTTGPLPMKHSMN
jgi:beta-glucosidase/6-phospho-beta-glucosidase/beta-galactosidase